MILRKVPGRAKLKFEEMSTILTKAEAIINLRPLTYVHNDVDHNVNLKNLFYAELDQHAPHLQSLFRKKAARTRKVAETLDQLFSTYDLQVSWLHFLVLDNNTRV